MVFFVIWWAWMNFTWFATAFDNDDWLYRVTTIVQMAGVLVLVAGVPTAFAHLDFTMVTFGYVVMRVAMVTQWIRVAHSVPEYRATALRYASGVSLVQVLWLARLLLPTAFGLPSFLLLALAEIMVPIWANGIATIPSMPTTSPSDMVCSPSLCSEKICSPQPTP